MKTKIVVGKNKRDIYLEDVRSAQESLIKEHISDNDKRLIDAIISHFACGRSTTWVE